MARKKIQKNISYDEERRLYYVTLNFGKDASGKYIKKYKTATRLPDARKILKKHEADKTNDQLVMPTKITFHDYSEQFLKRKERNRAATTIYGYKTALQKHVYPDLGQLSIQSISVSRLNLFFDGLFEKKELGANSIRKIYDLLKSIFKSAVADEVISKNPIEKIEPIKKQKPEHNYYTIDQFRKLLEIIAGDRMEIVVLLAGILGLRREEIAGLQWTNVDFVLRTIKIVQSRIIVGKNEIIKDTKSESSYRILKMPDYLSELLVTIKENQNRNRELLGDSAKGDFSYVVSWEDGTPYRPNYLSDLFKKIIDDNDLPHIRLHDLRHTFASIANDLGVSIYDISKALGHAETRITDKVYTHMFDSTHARAIDAIASAVVDIEKK